MTASSRRPRPPLLVRPATPADLGAVAAIYNAGIRGRRATFEVRERTPEELALMRCLKQALDPKGILNPGKVI